MALKINRLTWGLLGIALLLAGGVTAWELRQTTDAENAVEVMPDRRQFNFTADTVQAIAIRQGGQYLKVYRGSGEKPTWKMDWPQPVEVSVPAVDFLLNTLISSQNDRDFDTSTDQLAEYGLTEPAAIMTIQLVTGKTHELILGNADFKGDSLYALIDPANPATETSRIHLVPRSLLELARRSPQDWQQAEL
ncbi:MAG: DUF4340 domain-containing protein [Synechocystis sp.]|nr:DUF4340 domain-containing protein [Synechocystis sp.]